MIPALLAPILGKLAGDGMELLASAVKVKGKEAVEKLIGVPIETAETEALKRLEYDYRDKLLVMAVELDKETSKRWESDNIAGTLPRIIRPLTLVYLLLFFTVLAFTDGSVLKVPGIYSEGVRDMLFVAIPAYFGLRAVEKFGGKAK